MRLQRPHPRLHTKKGHTCRQSGGCVLFYPTCGSNRALVNDVCKIAYILYKIYSSILVNSLWNDEQKLPVQELSQFLPFSLLIWEFTLQYAYTEM